MRIRRCMAALLAMLATAAACAIGLAPAASAGTLAAPPDGTYLTYTVDGRELWVGAIGQDTEGRLVYCMEAGKDAQYDYSDELDVADSAQAARVAWLVDRYRATRDAHTQAAIGLLVHDAFDGNPAEWARHRASIEAQYPTLDARARELDREAAANAPEGVDVGVNVVDGIRSGWVDAHILNGDQGAVVGVAYRAVIEGPAQFVDEDGAPLGTSVSGVSQEQAVRHHWVATGRGEVKVNVEYDRHRLQQLVSEQDYIRYGGKDTVSNVGVTFQVRKDFTPSLSTVAVEKIVDAGRPVSDEVTSGVSGDDSHWPAGLELVAEGYYFDDIPAKRLVDRMSPKDGESVEDFLARVERRGYTPAAYGEAAFTDVGQTRVVTAHTAAGEEYLTPERGGVGTWVWAFDATDQSAQAREYVLADAVSGFLEAAETGSNRSKLDVESSATEHSAVVGSHLSDVITVSGFPDDHGLFAGDEEYGIGADEPLAQVSVWWSGDPENPDNDDAYAPQGADPPQEDAHHKLIGTWDYPAANGRIRVGGGSEDAHGEAVNIIAETHGWYVFVYSFGGDDRVEAAASRYDDRWEHTRVTGEEPEEPEEPETPEEPEEPEPLPVTGSALGALALTAVAALAVGALTIAAIHRRSL